MRINLVKTLALLLLLYSSVTSANDFEMVTLGVNCGAVVGSGEVLAVDPYDSSFLKKAESGECYSGSRSEQMPRWAAQMIVDASSTNAYYIYEDDSSGYTKLPTISSSAESDLPEFSFSLPWLLGIDTQEYEPAQPNPPSCSLDEDNGTFYSDIG